MQPGSFASWRPRIPRGIPLPESEWRLRHGLIVAALAAHVLALFGYGVLIGAPAKDLAAVLCLVVALAVLAAFRGSRLRRSLSATLGLMTCSTALVTVSHGLIVAHFDLFVVTVLVALYQDWRPFVTAFLFVVLGHLVIGVVPLHLTYESGMHTAGDRVLLALAHGGFVAAVGVVLMIFWGYAERSSAREETYRMQLLDTEMGAISRLREAGQMREDLITSVTHEFRTPLTAIHGVVTTLRTQGDRISPEMRDALLQGIEEHGQRLARLLEDMLAAASVSMSDPTAIADASLAIRAKGDGSRVTAMSAPDLVAVIAPESLRQLLDALLRHAVDHARSDRPIRLEGAPEAGDVVIRLRYFSDAATAECPNRLLEPFASRESAEHGRPISLDLYLARRLAEVNDGSAQAVVDEDNAVMITVRLPRFRAKPEPAPATQARSEDDVVRTS